MRSHEQFVSRTPLGPRDYAAMAPIFGFTNADDMYKFAQKQQVRAAAKDFDTDPVAVISSALQTYGDIPA